MALGDEERLPAGSGWKESGHTADGEAGEGESMPGIVRMEENGANGAVSAKEKQKMASHEEAAPVLGAPVKSASNGNGHIPQVDGPVDSQTAIVTNGVPASPAGKVDIPSSILDLPPEIQHITASFQPLSKLIERVTQECFNGLAEVINEMADMTPAPLVNGVSNGGLPNGTGDSTSADVAKKVRLMEFANRHRERFIKLLVLSQWSRQAEDVSKMIDLWNWYRMQIDYYDAAADWVGHLRLTTSQAKMPNPDIRTALEALSKGRVSWMPDVSIECRKMGLPPSADIFRSWGIFLRSLSSLSSSSKLSATSTPSSRSD